MSVPYGMVDHPFQEVSRPENHRISYLRPFCGNRKMRDGPRRTLCDCALGRAGSGSCDRTGVLHPQVGDQHHRALTAPLPREIRSISDQDRNRDRNRDRDRDRDQNQRYRTNPVARGLNGVSPAQSRHSGS